MRVMDHAMLYRVAREVGVETPTFYKPEDEAALRTLVPTLDLGRREYLLKTVPGTVAAEARNGRYTKIASADAATFEAESREIAARLGEFPLIAEVVPGDATNCIGVCMLVDRCASGRLCAKGRSALARKQSVQRPHPAGAGPTRDRLMVPAVPALLPPVRSNVSCAVLQLLNLAVAVPTATV